MAEQEVVVVWTSTKMAAELGIDRSTLVRLEQKGHLPLAPKTRVTGRVYDAELRQKVKVAFRKYVDNVTKDGFDRPEAPKKYVVA